MKKNKLFMVGFVGIMMAAALLLSSCGDKENTDPKKITITDLPSGQTVIVSLYSAGEKVATGISTVSSGGSLTVDLYKFAEGVITNSFKIKADAEKWTGTGSYYVDLTIVDSNFSNYFLKDEIEIKDTTTTRAFTDFEKF